MELPLDVTFLETHGLFIWKPRAILNEVAKPDAIDTREFCGVGPKSYSQSLERKSSSCFT